LWLVTRHMSIALMPCGWSSLVVTPPSTIIIIGIKQLVTFPWNVESHISITGMIKNARRASVAPFMLSELAFVHDN